MAQDEIKRLFFGVEIHSPWPFEYPQGRILHEEQRHMTLAFLGNIPYLPLKNQLTDFPKIDYNVGSVGYFDSCLILPPKHPHVVAWHAKWLELDSGLTLETAVQGDKVMQDFELESLTIGGEHSQKVKAPPIVSDYGSKDCVNLSPSTAVSGVIEIQKKISDWLESFGYSLDKRPWLPHVTICRQPFDSFAWKEAFNSLPFYTGAIHLYESTGNLQYLPSWSYPVMTPFEEINHTADMAFLVRGKNNQELYTNALGALAFKAPELLPFYQSISQEPDLDDVIARLNSLISKLDCEVGSPFKAISYHDEVIHLEHDLLQWTMIVDV